MYTDSRFGDSLSFVFRPYIVSFIMDNPKHDLMQIGDLADRAGVTTRAIRYYEELGIVEPEERSTGGFRLYSQAQLRSLQIVQSLKTLGFGLEHIRRFFNLKHCMN